MGERQSERARERGREREEGRERERERERERMRGRERKGERKETTHARARESLIYTNGVSILVIRQFKTINNTFANVSFSLCRARRRCAPLAFARLFR